MQFKCFSQTIGRCNCYDTTKAWVDYLLRTGNGHLTGARNLLIKLAPQVRLVSYNPSVYSPVRTVICDNIG